MNDSRSARLTMAAILAALPLLFPLSCSHKPASIEGRVLLSDGENHEGTQVYIPGTPYQAITDWEGKFVFPEVPTGDYELVARHDGYEEYRKSGIRLQPGSLLRLLPLSLQRTDRSKEEGGLEGVLRLEDGGTPAGALVILETAGRLASVDALGRFSMSGLKPGSHTLVVVKAGYVAERESAEIVAGATTSLESLVLTPARGEAAATREGQISGRVAVIGGGSQAGVLVAVEGTGLMASTDAEGRFSIAHVPSGTYSVRFQKDQFFTYRKLNVAVGPEGETELEATLRPIPSDSIFQTISQTDNIGSIHGLVGILGLGNLEGIEIVLDPLGISVRPSLEGEYVFPAVPEGVYSITARKEGHRSGIVMGVRVEPGEETFAPELVLEPIPVEELPPRPADVEGSVFLEGEAQHLGVLVALVNTQHTAITATDGRFRFEKVTPGEYELLAVKEGFEPLEIPIEVPGIGDLVLRPITLKKVIVRPVILDTTPRDGERGVPVNDYVEIIVQFDQRMDGASVKRAFRISPPVKYELYFGAEKGASGFHGVRPDLRVDADFLTLMRTEEPPSAFDRLVVRLPRSGKPPVGLEQRYQVTMADTAKNLKGVSLAEPYRFSFTTGGARLTASWPADGDTDVYLLEYDAMIFDFNTKIDRDSFRNALRIRPRADSVPLFLPEKAPAGDRVKVEVVLREDTRYTLEIDRSLRSADGKPLDNLPYRIQFQTGGLEGLGEGYEDYEDLFEGEFGRESGAVRRHLQRRAEREARHR